MPPGKCPLANLVQTSAVPSVRKYMSSPVQHSIKLITLSATSMQQHACKGNQLTAFSLPRDVLSNAICLRP